MKRANKSFNVALLLLLLSTGAVYAGPSLAIPRPAEDGPMPVAAGLPFSNFDVEILDLVLQRGDGGADQCLLGGRLRLHETSDGVGLLQEDLTLHVGPFRTTIPAGSFRVAGSEYRWHGNVDGAVVGVLLEDLGSDSYSFAIAVGSIDLGGISDRATVGLAIGDDAGRMTAHLEGRLKLAARPEEAETE